MKYIFTLVLLMATLFADKLLPEKNNQIIIYLNQKIKKPTFYMIFSKEDIAYKNITQKQLEVLVKSKNKDLLLIKLHSKSSVKAYKYHYFFGNKQEDKNKPWNNGEEFSWKSWKQYDADIWDNVSVVYVPKNLKEKTVYIKNIVIRRGGFSLLDTRKKESLISKNKISFKVEKNKSVISDGVYNVYHFGKMMESFKQKFYEIRSPVLKLAIDDLGQTDKKKYVSRGKNWCSEYAAYLYNENGIIAPNPNKKDLHFKNLKVFYEKNGKVYSFLDVIKWSDSKKVKLIKPGTLVSFCVNDCKSAHTVIFNSWTKNKSGKITKFSALSGNNRGMVYFHKKLRLDMFDKKMKHDKKYKTEFLRKSYFAVPNGL
ncbi:MAG: hypothetical protein Q9M32_03750 [Sulfurimonas sp.]|nr:hypothetical protein [Sulfurimonas sp.]MDQ7059909.1 hypothetical protein [Sulfurimonas sp.]